MNACPCCSNQMLRHVRHHEVYWFCRSCWQEMPLLEQKNVSLVPTTLERYFSTLDLKRALVTV